MNTNLILSIIALGFSGLSIIISIKTAREQSRIALFDKKMDCYNNLSIYFQSRSIFTTAEVKLMTGNVKLNNRYKGSKKHLFSEIRLLFSKNIWEIVEKIDNLYVLIHKIDSYISIYFSLIEADDNINGILEKIKEYNEMTLHEYQVSINDEEEKKFKRICEDNKKDFKHPIDGIIRLNYYDLTNLQSEAYIDVGDFEKELFLNMEDEIKIRK